MLQLIELDPGLLPDVLGPTEPAGEVRASGARELGLPADAVVGPGTGDDIGAALGLGARPGGPVVSLGTSGWDTRGGVTLDAPEERDVETLDRLRRRARRRRRSTRRRGDVNDHAPKSA